jgi:UDP:flavonoid glycosyltransferase YjiC (YdhE family)
VLATLGTLGDLHPFMALALALRDRGVHPVIATSTEYRDKVTAAGIEFQPVKPSFAEIERDLGMTRAELTQNVVAHPEFLMREVVLPYLRAAYDDMLPLVSNADAVVTSSLAFGARLAAEKCGIAWIAVVLQPFMFMSAYDPPVIPTQEWLGGFLRWLGPTLTKPLLRAVKASLQPMLKPVRRLRQELGLDASGGNAMFEGQFSAAGAIALYSSLLGGAQPDFPTPALIAGFASYDSEDGRSTGLEPGLEQFLRAGDAPLVFTLGSAIVRIPGSFYQESLAAARRLGKRAVLLVGETPALANGRATYGRAADVFICAYAQHSLLFPRAAAVVHQGGVGTFAQALKSGRTQLVVPFFADQSDNAARAQRIGVARVLRPGRYTVDRAVRELETLLTDQYTARAAQVREHLASEDGSASAASFIIARFGDPT